MTPWSNDEYLETLARSRIRRVFPWSYLGGTAYGQCYDSVLKVMDRIRDWSEIQIYVGLVEDMEGILFSPGHPKMKRKFCQIMTNLSEQKSLSRLVFGQELENFDGLDIEGIANGLSFVSSKLQSFAFSTAYPCSVNQPHMNIDPIILELEKAQNLHTLDISGRTNLNLAKVFENGCLKTLKLEVDYIREFVANDLQKVPNLNTLVLHGTYGEEFGENEILKVLFVLKRLSGSLKNLSLKGQWVDSHLVTQLPPMPMLESMRFFPTPSRLVATLSEGTMRYPLGYPPHILFTEDVREFAKRCPIFRSPRFLRYPRLMHDLQLGENGAAEKSEFSGKYGMHAHWRMYCQTDHSA